MHNTNHIPWTKLDSETRDVHRQMVDLVGDLEAISWYEQRIALTEDLGSAERLRQQQEEECRHAAIALEWIRRQMPSLDEHLRRYLFHPATPPPESR